MRPEHVVIEAENAVGRRRVPAMLKSGLEHSAQEDGCVLKLLGRRRLDVEVVAGDCAQRVVLPWPRVKGRSGTLDQCPVEHVPPALFLFPAAQPLFKVTLQLGSCQKSQQIKEK